MDVLITQLASSLHSSRFFSSPLGLVIPFMAWKYNKGGAQREAKRRGDMIEKYLPYAASYTAAMSAANATPAKIFRSLAMNKDIYGDVADDAAMVYRDVTLLGYDLITAMKLSVDRAASVWLTEFFKEWLVH